MGLQENIKTTPTIHTLPSLERTILPPSRQMGCVQGWGSTSLWPSGPKIPWGGEGRKNPLGFSQQTINNQSGAQSPAPVGVELSPFPFPFAFQTKEEQSPLLNNAIGWPLRTKVKGRRPNFKSLTWVGQSTNIKFRLLIAYNNVLTSFLRCHCFWPAQPLEKTLANLAPAITTGVFWWGFWKDIWSTQVGENERESIRWKGHLSH